MSKGKRIGDAYIEGKKSCLNPSINIIKKIEHLNVNCFYGDPTLKIKKMW